MLEHELGTAHVIDDFISFGAGAEHFSNLVVFAAHVLDRRDARSEVLRKFPIAMDIAAVRIFAVERDKFFDALARPFYGCAFGIIMFLHAALGALRSTFHFALSPVSIAIARADDIIAGIAGAFHPHSRKSSLFRWLEPRFERIRHIFIGSRRFNNQLF